MFNQKHVGPDFDDFLRGEDIYEEVVLTALKESIADLLRLEMQKKDISKVRMAELMGTSRSSLDRLFDPRKDVTLKTLGKAASALGKRLHIGMEDVAEQPPMAGC